jgi:hypothetical protein
MRAALALGLAAALGCGSSSNGGGHNGVDAAGGPDTAAVAHDGATVARDPNAVIGSFDISLVPELNGVPAHTTLLGVVSDGPTPANQAWATLDSAEGCTLLKPVAPFCDPRCEQDSVCVGTNKCQANPTAQNVGPVQVSGLGKMPFTSQFIGGAYQLPADVDLPYPPAPEGTEVRVAVNGGVYGAFALSTKAAQVLSWSNDLVLDRDKPVALTWASPAMPALARMLIKVDISHHGGSKGQIACDVADSGAFMIPAKLVTGLINLGVAGFPRITLTRISSSKVPVSAGQVELIYQSAVTRDVKVVGVESCDQNTPCPAGQTCMTMTSLCVP